MDSECSLHVQTITIAPGESTALDESQVDPATVARLNPPRQGKLRGEVELNPVLRLLIDSGYEAVANSKHQHAVLRLVIRDDARLQKPSGKDVEGRAELDRVVGGSVSRARNHRSEAQSRIE